MQRLFPNYGCFELTENEKIICLDPYSNEWKTLGKYFSDNSILFENEVKIDELKSLNFLTGEIVSNKQVLSKTKNKEKIVSTFNLNNKYVSNPTFIYLNQLDNKVTIKCCYYDNNNNFYYFGEFLFVFNMVDCVKYNLLREEYSKYYNNYVYYNKQYKLHINPYITKEVTTRTRNFTNSFSNSSANFSNFSNFSKSTTMQTLSNNDYDPLQAEEDNKNRLYNKQKMNEILNKSNLLNLYKVEKLK